MPFLPLKSDLDDFFPKKKENYWNSIISWESNFIANSKNLFLIESNGKKSFKVEPKIGNELELW